MNINTRRQQIRETCGNPEFSRKFVELTNIQNRRMYMQVTESRDRVVNTPVSYSRIRGQISA
jgi:hypothetical protein